MEQFIQEKYAQVKDLQKYLVEELQLIENNKKKQRLDYEKKEKKLEIDGLDDE